MKTAIKLFMLLAVVGYLIFAVSTMSREEDKRICTGTEIIIGNEVDGDFVDTTFVKGLLTKANTPILDQTIRNIDIGAIRRTILESPYIDSVICYFTPENTMCLRIFPRKPVLHVIPTSGGNFYMDAKGNAMPTNLFLQDLCLVTGNVSTKYARENLLDMAIYINTHEPWNREIQQIHVADNGRMELVTQTGDHTIILGDATNIEDKLRRLAIFCEEGLNKAGWNKYDIIDLSYAGQVVCTRKKTK
ncbi:MAG: cell division protein FtsQ/DivIB [Bacteroidaceae bacterium]|nr:cell division protein FtsQ/DivIB [Bacteroidaceae bacterium]